MFLRLAVINGDLDNAHVLAIPQNDPVRAAIRRRRDEREEAAFSFSEIESRLKVGPKTREIARQMTVPPSSGGCRHRPGRYAVVHEADPIRLLVVEDDDIEALAVGRAVEPLGLDVRVATSAEQAQAIVAKGWIPHVVLLDEHLPGISGSQLADRIRADARWGEPQILQWSADESACEESDTVLDKSILFAGQDLLCNVVAFRVGLVRRARLGGLLALSLAACWAGG